MASEDRGSVLTEEKRLWKYITHLHKYPQAKLLHTFSTQFISLAVKYILQQDLFISSPATSLCIANLSTSILLVVFSN